MKNLKLHKQTLEINIKNVKHFHYETICKFLLYLKFKH